MSGTLLQVNRSRGGLPKRPISGVVMVDSTGIDGDWQTNRVHHGGPDKAVLMLAVEVVRDLVSKGFPIIEGSLGENLTVEGLDPSLWRHGQRYRVGATVVIELTKLREPCVNLNRYGPAIKQELYDVRCKDNDYNSPCWGRGGFYARVIQTGLIAGGVPVLLESDIA